MADAIVVLGAALAAPGVAGPAVRRRVAKGAALVAEGRADVLVVSGGLTVHPPAEAEVMRDVAVGLGVAPGRVVVEDKARNTFENAVYTGQIARERGWTRMIVVTDPFHLPRALYVFRRLGLDVEGAASDERAGTPALAWYAGYVREVFAFLKSWYLFRIGRHRPVLDRVWGK